MFSKLALLSLFAGHITAQQVGTQQAESHPKLSWKKCTKGGGCSSVSGSVVLDSNWRWLHTTSGYTNCYTGNTWDASLCPNPTDCAKNCAVDGADYSGTYGITTSGDALTHKFVTKGQHSTNIGSRVYLMDSSDSKYEIFKLNNKEFTFDVDVSNLPCGLNGALYFVEMDADGGMSKYPSNKAGAKYGTGYCDAQCPHDIKFVNGEANLLDWKTGSDPNSGTGRYGTCCAEMDIWEANSMATAYTPHPCTVAGQVRCSGNDCGDSPDNRYGGVCDKDGCDFNSFRMGDRSFFGKGKTVDTTKKMTVVTQFIGSPLTEIRRLYVQNGQVYQNSKATITGMGGEDSLTDSFCAAQKTAFGDTNDFAKKGGMKRMGTAHDKGMVLVMSIWDDHAAQMLWLDSNYPLEKDASTPGVARGECPTSSGKPTEVEAQYPGASVTFSNIRFGDIDSTYK